MFVFNTKVSLKKRIDVALLDCFGLGHSISTKLFSRLGLNIKSKKISIFKSSLDYDNCIPALVKNDGQRFVGLALKNFIFLRLKHLKRLKNLKSFRHSLFLPVRGQRTRKNSNTQKGRRGRKIMPIKKKKKG